MRVIGGACGGADKCISDATVSLWHILWVRTCRCRRARRDGGTTGAGKGEVRSRGAALYKVPLEGADTRDRIRDHRGTGDQLTTAQPDRRAARARATGPVGGVLGRELVKGLNEYV
jgi:hypothetical protein